MEAWRREGSNASALEEERGGSWLLAPFHSSSCSGGGAPPAAFALFVRDSLDESLG